MGRIRIACVGAGWVTGARHLPALLRSPEFEVVGIIDRTTAKARAYAERFGLRRWAGDPQLDVPWLSEVDALTIGTPPAVHFSLARRALAVGKHVLMEKPVALAVAEGEALREQAAGAGVVLAVVHNFQFARSALTLRRRIASGRFGRVTGLFAVQLSSPRRRLPAWYEHLPWGLFYDEAPHLLYLTRAFGGEPRVVHAHALASPRGVTTPAIVMAQLACGDVPATLYMNFEAPVSEWHLVVMTERRVLALDVFRDVLVEVPDDDGHRAFDILRSSGAAALTHGLGVAASGARLALGKLSYGNDDVVARFAAAVREGVAPQGISIDDGVKVLALQHAIMAAAGAGA